MAKKKKRANRDGSVYKTKDGKFRVAFTVKDRAGKSKRVYRVAKDREHADDILAKFQADAESHKAIRSRHGFTIGEMVDLYLRDQVDGHLSKNTVASYQFARKFFESLEDRQVQGLTAVDLSDWMHSQREAGVGANSLTKSRNLLARAYEHANRMGLVDGNPAKEVKAPKKKQARPDIFTDEEVTKILEGIEGHRLAIVAKLALIHGMRQGEILGLRWRDIDFESGTLSVVQQVVETEGEVYIQEIPKTDAGRRSFALTRTSIDELNLIRRDHVKKKWFTPDGLVVRNRRGGLTRRTNFAYHIWKPLLKELGIKPRGVHACRHTCATTMLRRGIPVTTVALILGHSNPSVTLSLYAQYVQHDTKSAAALMDDLGRKADPG